jgi:hypothetical protein
MSSLATVPTAPPHPACATAAPAVDDGWFFDTELLVLAQRRGLRIHEVPVDWVDDPDSRVRIVPNALADLRGVARLLLASHPRGFARARAAAPAASAVHPDRACA